jgi:oligosaccharide reducing-end xylanase
VTSGNSGTGGSTASGGTTGTGGAAAVAANHNYFADRGHTDADTQAKINSAWQKLFAGDPSTESVYFAAGTNANGVLAYIKDIGNGDVRSEGMSYGMMVAVQTDHQAEFKALWNWAVTYMYHADASHPAHGYFAWQMNSDGTEMDPMPAPDGEEYFAAALLFANARWGSSTGIYDYNTRAQTLLKDLIHHDQMTGNTSKGSKTCNAIFNPTEFEVRFSPDVANQTSNGDFTDPSYHLPAFYEAFARVGPSADATFWATAATKSRAFFLKAANPTTGLTPDYANFDGTPKAASWDALTATFRYDAFRTVVNWSVDYAWNKKSKDEATLSNRLLSWFGAARASAPGSLYLLDGTSQGTINALGLLACNAVGALAADATTAGPFVDALWNASLPTGTWRYYDGMLYFLAVLHVSGQFRDWTVK